MTWLSWVGVEAIKEGDAIKDVFMLYQLSPTHVRLSMLLTGTWRAGLILDRTDWRRSKFILNHLQLGPLFHVEQTGLVWEAVLTIKLPKGAA